MPVPLRPPYVATYTRHFRRVRGAAGNWMRLILAAALFSTSVTVLLTHKLHLPLPMVSRVPPSTLFASEDSNSQYSVVPLINSSSSTSFANFDMRSVEVTSSDVGHMMQISSRPERPKKEVRQQYGYPKVAFWALPPDEALLYAKREVEHAPLVIDDPDLYAPVYWNLSIFKRSYELMERILKIYIYPDGTKPIFHTPELHGIYASEGWFMKLIEQNRRFVVKDPKKAHLFYLPYSSRQLRDAVYIPGSHNLRPLAIFLRDYVNNISSKYPFWNRTRGLDHFLVACHDWGPYSTTLHTELYKNTIKALCNADISEGIFIRGKDVSLPETTIKVPKRPLKYIGGKRVSQRPILAFYAGLMHGRVRPILERLWGNDTEGDIRIFRRLPNRVSRNMSYIEHMKSSRFCICPMGYEVNSPRIVEAIYYECVPVIIADNFVLPFEEVLNWSTFSVVIEEKDIANLKNILLSIPLRRYLKMQKCVQRVQKHFLWHVRPEKYDLFHMLLHSIWFSRLNQFSNSQ